MLVSAGVGKQTLNHHQSFIGISEPSFEVFGDEGDNVSLFLVLLEDGFSLFDVKHEFFLEDFELAVSVTDVLDQRQH